jgi:PEP-CTERM motif
MLFGDEKMAEGLGRFAGLLISGAICLSLTANASLATTVLFSGSMSTYLPGTGLGFPPIPDTVPVSPPLPFSGTLTYDPNAAAAPSPPGPTIPFTFNNSVTAFSLTFNGSTFNETSLGTIIAIGDSNSVSFDIVNLTGAQFFNIILSAAPNSLPFSPDHLPVTFNLSDFSSSSVFLQLPSSPLAPIGYEGSLDALSSVAAVPEPTTWAMMLLGFAGICFMVYCRKSEPALMTA